MNKHTRNNQLVGAGVIAAVVAILAITAHAGSQVDRSTLRISVTGTGPMDVSWHAGDKDAQNTNAPGDWEADYTYTGDAPYASVVAQNGNGQQITCTITEGGQVVAQNTSYGPYALAQCFAPC